MPEKAIDPRPSWDDYFMEIAHVVAKRSNCSRRHVGAVVMRDNHILSTGYNGTPHGVKNCFAGGCPRCAGQVKSGSHLEECLCVHAEQNAICQAALYGTSLQGASIYVTLSPCLTCAKLIINSGIGEVVYDGEYEFLATVEEMFESSGVKYRKYAFKEGK
ncbi:MAG: dCMP deaminase family protein [Kiritimatiellae bacterium]|nr:dCMP deaminase family protein [Kiritimatiellia bacterium]